ncbi:MULTISPECIES: ABC transporter permease [Cyanophyceae]|uniref:ABC transporter permease n=1 Tax=Cyanophyceae TaxID=3028117 RepID=UPI0016895AD4|nr:MULTISPECIES: ABC transporter permease [Cyanophyceae]MBD1916572.1 ABC transporter permease [Phormidium sp. FACHB-77]MBD2032139.1 ABC transporter permease [Phormidium sp. FACHB-322]MBD2053019.1 ABC transporter permease [Leptolyngbya sp. FACHB-60]
MSYLLSNPGDVLTLLLQHLRMTGIALGIAIALAVPLALLVSRLRWLAVPVLGGLGVLYTIPSLALIIFLVPLFGLNATSVIVAMVLYTQVILVRNLTVGLAGINPAVLEAARGMGMSVAQRWWRVQVPLVLPVFLAGVRIAAIVAIAIATIGAKFNAGGLGKLLFDGIQTNRYDKIVAGAIAVAALALVINGLLLALEHYTQPQRRLKHE